MIRTVLFDVDGTLLDTLNTITHYVNLTLRAYGCAEIAQEDCRRFVGNGAKKLIDRAFRSRGVEDADLIHRALADYNRAYDSAPSYLTAPFSGIVPLLAALRARGIAVGAVSNKPHSATAPLVKELLSPYVMLTAGGKEGVPLKPDPTTPLSVMEQLGGTPGQTAFVGDSPEDIQTGKNMGAGLCIGVSWGFRDQGLLIKAGADAIAHTPMDIYTIIKEKNHG